MRRGRGDRLSLTISAKPDGVGGCVSAIDPNGQTIWIADAQRGEDLYAGGLRKSVVAVSHG
jgi:hypothetical protein